MRIKKIIFISGVLVSFFICTGYLQAQTSQETLKQYIDDLQKNPDNFALRERIIKHVQEMKIKPAVSREAERFMNRGAAAMKSAKDVNGFSDAVEEFEKATLTAPWLANAYWNLGIAQNKVGQYISAIKSFKLYLAAAPDAADKREVEKLIDEIEYQQEKAVKESNPAAIATKQQNDYDAWLKKLDGGQWRDDMSSQEWCQDNYIEIHGKEVQQGYIITRPSSPCANANPYMGKAGVQARAAIEGKTFLLNVLNSNSEGTISEDGETIIVKFNASGYAAQTFIYKRVKSPRWTIWNRF